MGTARAACSDCEGVGEKLRDKDRCVHNNFGSFPILNAPSCKKCKGSKKVKEKNRQEIFIEKGMADKQRIVLTGAGDQEVLPTSNFCPWLLSSL